jgi:hypothetical protein
MSSADMLYAQIGRPRAVEIGLFAGPTIDWSSTGTRGYNNAGIRLGGVYGLNVDINLAQTSSNYFFSTGVNARHIRYGFKFTDNYIYKDVTTGDEQTIERAEVVSTFTTTYVSLPTAIKLKTNEFGRFVVFGLVGLEHGIAVSSKSNDEVTDVMNARTMKKTEKNDHYKHTAIFKESLYIVLGTEYIIQDQTKITFGLGYDHGFNNMFRKKYTNTITSEAVNIHTHRIEFQFGVIF